MKNTLIALALCFASVGLLNYAGGDKHLWFNYIRGSFQKIFRTRKKKI